MAKQPKHILARYKYQALTLNHKVPGMTQKLDKYSTAFYGGKYMVCESLSLRAAKTIAEKFGWEWVGIEEFPEQEVPVEKCCGTCQHFEMIHATTGGCTWAEWHKVPFFWVKNRWGTLPTEGAGCLCYKPKQSTETRQL